MKAARSDLFVKGLARLVLAGILLFAGCERKPRVGRALASWRTSGPRGKVHGIDEGSAYFGRYGQGSAIIIWTDLLACGFPIEATWDRTRDCAKYAGYLRSPSGARVDVECYVTDRMRGTMTIHEQEYDLANGSLFLVQFRAPEIKVGQISQDIYATTSKYESRKRLVKNAPEIRAFYEKSAADATEQ
ncbi:MAG: hypothetical protein JSW59_16265 [Phycisphaerales bacterium]|nr:MAG: hypothetical protein JSW59_16265 [Phycisphaerales bacterium]